MSTEIWFPPTGALDSTKHATFIKRMPALALDANIPQELLWRPLPAVSPVLRTWIEDFNEHRLAGFCGLLLTGLTPTLHPLALIGALTGCLNRNFVRARMFSIAEVLAAVKENDALTATCLLIPDFVVTRKDDKKALPLWHTQQITTLLTQRWRESKLQTVIYAPSIEAIGHEYGPYVASLIQNHYIQVEVA